MIVGLAPSMHAEFWSADASSHLPWHRHPRSRTPRTPRADVVVLFRGASGSRRHVPCERSCWATDGRADCSRAGSGVNVHRRCVVTSAVVLAFDAPRAWRTDAVFLWLATARPLRTLGTVQRMAQSSSASVFRPVPPPDPVASPVVSRGEFARAFTSPLRRAFRTCEPRRLRRSDCLSVLATSTTRRAR